VIDNKAHTQSSYTKLIHKAHTQSSYTKLIHKAHTQLFSK